MSGSVTRALAHAVVGALVAAAAALPLPVVQADWSAHGRENRGRRNGHPAEGWKWTHKGPHVFTRQGGHVR